MTAGFYFYWAHSKSFLCSPIKPSLLDSAFKGHSLHVPTPFTTHPSNPTSSVVMKSPIFNFPFPPLSRYMEDLCYKTWISSAHRCVENDFLARSRQSQPRLGEKVFIFVSHCLSVYKFSNEMPVPWEWEEISFFLIKSSGHVWIQNAITP